MLTTKQLPTFRWIVVRQVVPRLKMKALQLVTFYYFNVHGTVHC